MTTESGPARQALPRPAVVVLLVILFVAGWLFFRRYTSSASRECLALYRAARTAADTARIDTTFTPASRKESDPRSCGFLRHSARWR